MSKLPGSTEHDNADQPAEDTGEHSDKPVAEQLTIEAVLTRPPRRTHINEVDRLERIERSLVDDEGPPTRPLRILNSKD